MPVVKPTYKDDNGNEFELLTFKEYRIFIGFPKVSRWTINYQIEVGGIDSAKVGRIAHIIMTEKSKAWRPYTNYGKRWKNRQIMDNMKKNDS